MLAGEQAAAARAPRPRENYAPPAPPRRPSRSSGLCKMPAFAPALFRPPLNSQTGFSGMLRSVYQVRACSTLLPMSRRQIDEATP